MAETKISENIEEYLEVLYRNGSNGEQVSTTQLSKDLGIAPGSVTQMLKKLEDLAQNGHTRDFKDLAKLHMATINGDKMDLAEFVKYLSSMDTKKSPFYYTSRLMVAQKSLASGEVETANKILDVIINDKEAPASISATAQTLK